TESDATLVAMHLGNGASAVAIQHGRCLDTSMGFTPLEGLVMGTRSGDLDPALVGQLARLEGVSVDQVEQWLNERSGLLGVSGRSRDMRDLIEHRGDDARTQAWVIPTDEELVIARETARCLTARAAVGGGHGLPRVGQ